MNEEIKTFLAEFQEQLNALAARLEKLEDEAAHTQSSLISIEHRISKSEKKLSDIGSIKIYKDIIRQDLKDLSREIKTLQKNLHEVERKSRKNQKEIKAFTKFVRFMLQKKGFYFGKKASLKEICSSLTSYNMFSFKHGTEGIDEL